MNDFSREQTNNFSRERAKRNDRAHRDTSIQNPRRDLYVKEQASERANDRAPLELGGSTTTNFKMTMKISKPESIPQFDKMTLN